MNVTNNVDVLTIISELSRLIGITFVVIYVATCHRIVLDACAVRFQHYAPLYRSAQHHATLNCRINTRKCARVI